ncbi:MAG TPA: M1 family aminopeptidase, partial [Longimicrobiaceae bacterium]|nr:M1 family aminopeptidase [Longimicrobiaceae bacterium]
MTLRRVSLFAAAAVTASASTAGAQAPPAAPAPDEMMRPGVSLELARHRAATLSGVRYQLNLDLTAARDTVEANLSIKVNRAPDAGDLVLDFRGPALRAVSANGQVVMDAEWRNGHLRIPARHLREGENEVFAVFTTRIAAAGASIIRFNDATDGGTYLYTLLVPADANQLFPSFDQPDLKARFSWSIVAPLDWQVLANGPGRRDANEEAALWTFEETEPISTYLAAFAAGPWRTWTDLPDGDDLPVTLYARQSRAGEVDADTLIAINRRAVRWLERYFGVEYPFTKFETLLAPAFPFGGMEHVGAIFYNENQFIFREPPTLGQQIGRKSTIYHEVAHQWFGDLVTMRWFDDLWLKEGFATYMAARMQATLDPASEAWKTFYLRNKPAAYAVDASLGTTPVWQELANLDQAKSNYGAIVYNKAPSVLKQLEYVVGERAFRDGVRRFLARHASGNATWRELRAAVGAAAGRDLSAWGAQYILRPGLPVLEATATDGGIAVAQRPAQALSGDAPWPI